MITLLLIFLFTSCVKPVQSVGDTRGFGPSKSESTVLAGDSPAKTISAIYSRSHAVVIGINDYRYDSVDLPDLQGAETDAKAVSLALKQRGFTVDEFLNADATHDDLQLYFSQTLPSKVGPEDRLIVYFAGHGITEDGRGYLLPQDAQFVQDGQPKKAMWMDMLQMYLQNTRARHIMYIADACYSGLGLNQALMRSSQAVPNRFRKVAAQKGHVAFSAGASTEKVLDRTLCKDYDGKLHGLFTCHLLIGLQGRADSNLDGVIQSSELLSHVERQVQEASNGQQNPRGFRVGDGDFLFANPSVSSVKEKLSKVDMVHRLSDLEKLAKAMDLASMGDNSSALNQLFQYRAAYGLVRKNPKLLSLSKGLKRKMNRFQQLAASSTAVLFTGHMHPINALWVLPDGEWLTGDESGELIIWSAVGQIRARLRGHQASISSFDIRDGKMVTGSEDGQIGVWRQADGALLHMENPNLGPVLHATINETGDRLLFSAENGLARQWDLKQNKLLGSNKEYGEFHAGAKRQMKFNKSSLKPFLAKPFGNQLLVLDRSNNPKIWKDDTPRTMLYGHSSRIIEAAISENRIITLDESGEARIWDAKSLSRQKVIKSTRRNSYQSASSGQGRSATSTFMAVNDITKQIVILGKPGILNLYNSETGSYKGTFKTGFDPLAISFSPDGERFFAASDRKAFIWRVSDQEILVELDLMNIDRYLFHPKYRLFDMLPKAVWTTDGAHIALPHNFGVSVISTENGERKINLGLPFSSKAEPKLSSNGQKIMVSMANRSAQVWRVNDGTLEWSSAAFRSPLSYLSFSATSDKSLMVDTEGNVHIYNFKDMSNAIVLKRAAAAPINPQAHFSPDGNYVLAAQALNPINDVSNGIIFLPDGTPDVPVQPPGSDISLDLGSEPIIYNASTGEVVKKLLVPPNTDTMMSQVATNFDTPIPRAIYDNNGGIVSSLGDGMIHRWAAKSNTWKSQLFCQSGSFESILTHPKNDTFITLDGSNHNNLFLWDWRDKNNRRTITSKRIEWAQFSEKGNVIKTKNRAGLFEYWSSTNLKPLGYDAALFAPRLMAKGGGIVNLNASAEDVYLALGTLPIRICPADFQPVYVIEEALDVDTAFVPEDLVPKYCPDKKGY